MKKISRNNIFFVSALFFISLCSSFIVYKATDWGLPQNSTAVEYFSIMIGHSLGLFLPSSIVFLCMRFLWKDSSVPFYMSSAIFIIMNVVVFLGVGLLPVNKDDYSTEYAPVGFIILLAVVMWWVFGDRSSTVSSGHDPTSDDRSDSRKSGSHGAERGADNGYSRDGREQAGTRHSMSIEEALSFLEISQPFSMETLQKRRKQLLLKLHPDHGGSGAIVRLVNEAFETLKPMAT